MEHPPAVVDFRACLMAVGSLFGKEPAIAEILPEGPIDFSTFRYITDKCGLVLESAAKPPPYEMGVPFLTVPSDSEPVLVSFPAENRVKLSDSQGHKIIDLADLPVIPHDHAIYVLSLRRDPKMEMNFLSRHAWFWLPIRENAWDYMQVGLATLMTNFLSLSVSIFMMVVYDRVVPNKSYDSLAALTVGVCLALGVEYLVRSIRGHFVEGAGQRVDLAIGRQLFDRMFEVRIEGLRGGVGAMANVFKEAEHIREFFTSATLIAFIDIPFVLLFVAVIYWVAGPLAYIPLAIIPLVAIFGLVIQPLMVQKATESYSKGRTKHSVVVETLGGIETLRTLGASNFMRRRWMEGSVQQAVSDKSSRMLANSAVSFTSFLQQASQVGMIVFGVLLMDDQGLTMGALVASVMMTSRAVAPMAQVAQLLVRLNQARSAFGSVDRIMRAPGLRNQTRRYTRRPVLDGKIEFRNVSFAYPEAETPALANISFTVQPGEKVAILGRVGSGKSTIAKLLLGLYQPGAGAILFDDIDARQLEARDLQDNLSALLQEVWLFSGTVLENIALGKAGATDDEILAASMMSTTHDFVSQQSLGYDLQVGEHGLALSGGQRQAVAIARTMLRQAPIVLMDEPTSAMDAATEATIIERIKSALPGKTLVLITHRSSLLDLVDRVIVVEHGRIIRDESKATILQPSQG